MIHVRQVQEHGDVVLELVGALDAGAARELAAIAELQPAALKLVIDLSGASPVQDLALGHLVEALPPARARTVRGVSLHHERLLKYLGERLDERSERSPEDDLP